MGTEETQGRRGAGAGAPPAARRCPGINFVGNIEGNELTKGKADVIVCEGLLGNVVLKLLEGVAEVIVDLAGTARAGELALEAGRS